MGMEDRIIPTIQLPPFEGGPLGLPFAYSLYGILLHMRPELATDH